MAYRQAWKTHLSLLRMRLSRYPPILFSRKRLLRYFCPKHRKRCRGWHLLSVWDGSARIWAWVLQNLPLQFLLKDDLHLTPQAIAGFFAVGQFSNYIKPVAGLLCDSVPLFGTRRRFYLLLSLLGTGLGWLMMNIMPHTQFSLLFIYTVMYIMVVFTSTSLGGVMVEVSGRFRAAGRMTAQRIAMFRIGSLFGDLIGGRLAYYPFVFTTGLAALLHLILLPLYIFYLPETPLPLEERRVNKQVWRNAAQQLRLLSQNRTLLSAAGMICLVAASPGFGTPLLFHQTNVLHFSKQFVGFLGAIAAGFGLLAAAFYHTACRHIPLRTLLGGSIVVHAIGTLFYLVYRDVTSAYIVTALSGITVTLATLPIYDLAVRATPRGSEALGYSVMMSVWNLTNALSNWSGSWLYGRFHLTFINLVWLNSGTTLLALLVVPFLPAVLMHNRDGATETS